MGRNLSQVSVRGKLDLVGDAVDQLVRITSQCFQLSEQEKCILVDCAFSGIQKILDNRKQKVLNRNRVHPVYIENY